MAADLRPAVLFDADGTLVATNQLHALAWSRALRQAGQRAPMDVLHRLVGGPGRWDTTWDIQAARAAGTGCVAVGSGGLATANSTKPAPYGSTAT